MITHTLLPTVAIVTALGALSLPARVDEPPIANGGFEAGFTAPWGTGQYAENRPIWWNSLDGQSAAEVDRQVKRSGERSLHIVNRSPRAPHVYGTTQQPLQIEPGRRYRVSLWARASGLASDGAVSILVDPEWKVRPIALPKGTYDWTAFSGEFSLPHADAQIRILSEDVGEAWIDDIQVQTVAETAPTSGADPGDSPLVPITLKPGLRAAGPISAANGGQVTAEDGTQVSIEPSGVAADTEITIQLFKPQETNGESITVYDIKLTRGQLLQPATLRLPIESEFTRTAEDVEVFHFDDKQSRWEQLPVALSDDHKSALVRAPHFSRFVKTEPFRLSDYFRETMQAGGRRDPLQVPYYNQGPYGWCWATCLSMLEGYQGHPRSVIQIARDFQARPDDATSDVQQLKTYLEKLHPDYQVEANGFVRAEALNGYLMYHLNQGRPVWVGFPYAGHAVVVVGFDRNGFYVHDPSGVLIEYTIGKAAAQRADSEGKLATHFIPWERWDIVADGNAFKAIAINKFLNTQDEIKWYSSGREAFNRFNPLAYLYSNQTLVVTSPQPAGRTLSLQLMPNTKSFVIKHERQLPSGRKTLTLPVRFFWNGTYANGWAFVHTITDEDLVEHPPGILCGNDLIQMLRPFVSNTSDREATVKVEVSFDGELLASGPTTLAAQTVQRPMDLKDFALRGKKTDGLNLQDAKLPLGKHLLRFELYEEGSGGQSRPVDSQELETPLAPQMVLGVRATEQDDRSVEIAWRPSPEEQWPNTKIVYQIRRGMRDYGPLVATTEPGAPTYRYNPADTELSHLADLNFSVWAHDLKSGTTSQDALPVRVEKANPQPPLASAGGFRLLKITVVSYDTAGKSKGQPLDMVTETTWVPVLITPSRTLELVLKEKREELGRRYGQNAGEDWRKHLPQQGSFVSISIPASWTLSAEEKVLSAPLKSSDVPPARRDVKTAGGPIW
ncbi:MAG: C39 family peptidase [Planctomycetes bacterium]|nr:C39 family peptidase [Planctomycetota bacterium]